MSSTLQIDGIDVFVEGEGNETIVMIHGWPDAYRLWDAQVAFFKPNTQPQSRTGVTPVPWTVYDLGFKPCIAVVGVQCGTYPPLVVGG